ncbi:hypothetical protein MMC19_004822 [Ptychographa xylographoides]|nr:hypothetical protein [Ptychographa xylographoides]
MSTPTSNASNETPCNTALEAAQLPSLLPRTINQDSLHDLELFHHYACYTYMVLSQSTTFKDIWRKTVPELAFKHTFLMHGILALSASHLAHLNPASKPHYNSLATQHYTSALALVRSPLSTINPANAHALFAFSSITAILAFALPSHHKFEPIDEVLDVAGLLKGVNAIVQSSWRYLKEGPFAGSLADDLDDDAGTLTPEIESVLHILEAKSLKEPVPDVFGPTICRLREMFQNVACKGATSRIAMIWLLRLEKPFVDALAERRPLAVAMTGVWAVVLHDLNMYWWANGKARALVAATDSIVGDEWQGVMGWTKKMVEKDAEVANGTMVQIENYYKAGKL